MRTIQPERQSANSPPLVPNPGDSGSVPVPLPKLICRSGSSRLAGTG
jgi:hypothetical protein